MNIHNVLIVILFLAPLAAASEPTVIYRSTDEHGVVSFSDTQLTAADDVVVVLSVPAREEELARAARQFEQQLALIEIMERSRREREAAELEREKHRVELARARADLERARAPVYVNQGGYWFPYYVRRYPKHGYRQYPHYGTLPHHGISQEGGRLSATRTLTAPFPRR